MLVGLNKILDEFDDGPSGTSLRALKTLTCVHNNLLRIKLSIAKFEKLIGIIKTLDEFEDECSWT